VACAIWLFARAINNRSGKDGSVTPASGLSGFGGWLLLLAIGVYLSPLRTIVNLSQIEQGVDHSVIQKFRLMFNGEIGLTLVVILVQICTAVFMARKSRRFVSVLIWNGIFLFLLPLADMIWVASILNLQAGQPFQTTMQRVATPDLIGQWISTGVTVGIWMLYVTRSCRVANTFVR
jgi:hypothetical protein